MNILVRIVTYAFLATCIGLVVLRVASPGTTGMPIKALIALAITLLVLRIMLLPFQAAGIVITRSKD